MILREYRKIIRMKVMVEIISNNLDKPISIHELLKLINDKFSNHHHKMSSLEFSSLIKQLKEYKKFSHHSSSLTEYIFVRWRK